VSTEPGAPPDRRTIRSYVRRTGRVTRAQSRALEELWPRYGLDADEPLDPGRVFGRDAPCFVEIGFGMGDALATMARDHPQRDYIGVEVHEAGIGRLMGLAQRDGLENLRVVRGDAVEWLRDRVADDALDAVLIFFPDPWPKKRHHKRRLIRPEFVSLVGRRLRPGGRFELATDWAPYAEQMLQVVEAGGEFHNVAGQRRFSEHGGERPVTRFQRRGERLGHEIFDLAFRRMARAD
jgi:tRNA (guanine-N7-)-methyltransferase